MFFIVGRARSGTTLLQTMLDAHPSVIIPSESSVLMNLKNKYYTCENWNNKKTDDFLNDIFKDRKLNQFWKLDKNKIKDQLYQIPESSRNYVLFCKIIYLNYSSLFGQKSIKLIGDKNPNYTLFIKDLIELFPEAKFIHIVRDYRANIASNRAIFSIKNIAVLAHSWKYHNLKIDAAKAEYPDRFTLLRYEDLVVNPVDEMKKVCSFLNISYNTLIFDYHETLNKSISDIEKKRYNKIHGNLLKPVNSEKINSWKNTLSEKDIALSEYITGEYALKYDYLQTMKPQLNSSMYLKSIYGNFKNRMIFASIKLYFYSPFVVKEMLSVFSNKMNVWFKLKNYYNQTDFIE